MGFTLSRRIAIPLSLRENLPTLSSPPGESPNPLPLGRVRVLSSLSLWELLQLPSPCGRGQGEGHSSFAADLFRFTLNLD